MLKYHKVKNSLIYISIAALITFIVNIAFAQTTISSDRQEKVIESQLQILTSPQSSLETRKISAGLLIDLNVKDATVKLKQLLDESPDVQCKLAIMQAIAERNEPPAIFIDSLLKILLNGNPDLQRSASVALGRYRNAKLTKTLVEIAKDSKKPINQRLAAIETLGYTRTKSAVEALINLMDKTAGANPNNQAITSACAVSLYQLTRMRFGTRVDKWKKWWSTIASKSPTQWLETQLDLLMKENRKLRVKLNQTEQELINNTIELFRIYPQNEADKIKFLQKRLTSNISADKQAALAILHTILVQGQSIPKQLELAIRNLISDEDSNVRLACAKLLQETGDKKAIPVLVDQLSKETNPLVKKNMLIALGSMGDEKLLDKLIDQLNSPLEPVSSGAAQAIAKIFQNKKITGKLRDKTVKALLERYKKLLPRNSQLKAELLHTMAIIADKRFIDIFTDALQSPNAGLRLDAVRGLTSIGGESVVELLLNQLNDSEPGVRAKIASGIADITSDPHAVEILLSRVNPNIEKDAQVRQATWNAVLVMVKSWPFEKQLKWAKQLTMRSDKISEEQMLELVELLNSQIPDVAPNWSVKQKVDTFVAFGDLLMSAKLPDESIKYYRQAIISANQVLSEKPLKLAEKILRKLLGSSQDGTAEAEFINDLSGILNRKHFRKVIDDFIIWAGKKENLKAARNIAKHFSKQMKNILTEHQKIVIERIIKGLPTTAPTTRRVATKPTS